MRNVFCPIMLTKKTQLKPVFRLDFESLPITDISGSGWNVENKGVTIDNGTGNLSTGYLKLDRSVYASLYDSGNFTIRTRLKTTSTATTGCLFGCTQSSIPNSPGLINMYNGQVWYVYDTWTDDGGLFGTLKINQWYTLEVIVENYNFRLKLDGSVVNTGIIKNTIRSVDLHVGAQTNYNGAGVTSLNLNCFIDYFELYNKAVEIV